jgi:hypothetical protein
MSEQPAPEQPTPVDDTRVVYYETNGGHAAELVPPPDKSTKPDPGKEPAI